MPRIDSSYFGSMIVDGKKYDRDILITWDGEIQERTGSHNFSKRDLEDVIMMGPEVVIVGIGNSGFVKIDPAAEVLAKVEGIEFIAKMTPKAVEDFNKYSRKKKVVGIFHITC